MLLSFSSYFDENKIYLIVNVLMAWTLRKSPNSLSDQKFAIQTQYFCKSAHNICNQNSFLQFKCKRIANLSQNHFQTFCDEVQIYCTLVQSKCNWYFLPLIICKKIAIFTHFESAKMLQFTAKKGWIKRMLESELS